MKLLKIVRLFALAMSITAHSDIEVIMERWREENVDDLRDLLMYSIQNTIALTKVVTQQTQQISEVRSEIQELKEEIEWSQVNKEETIALQSQKIEELEHQMQIKKLDDAMIAVEISQLKEEVKENIQGMKEEIKLHNLNDATSVTVLNGEVENGEPKCAKVCSGTTGRRTTWSFASGKYGLTGYKEVDISGCGFVKTPAITTTIEGYAWYGVSGQTVGISTIYRDTPHSFFVGIKPIPDTLLSSFPRRWNVEWIAVGFTC